MIQRDPAKELLQYFWRRRLWWLVPLAIVLAFGLVFSAGHGRGIGPFIYTNF